MWPDVTSSLRETKGPMRNKGDSIFFYQAHYKDPFFFKEIKAVADGVLFSV